MANVSRNVLRHAVLLNEGARQLHRSGNAQAPYKTTLVTPNFDWDIRVSDTWQPENLRPIASHRAARLGHSVVAAAAQRPSAFGRSAFVRAAGLGVEETTFIAEHGYGPSQRYVNNRDGSYALRMLQASADVDQPQELIPNDSTRGREVIARFMALSLNEVVLTPSRSLEALATDYRRLEAAMVGLADNHRKSPLDGTIYYFNAGSYTVQVGGTERMVPGRDGRSDALGWISMNLYHVSPDQRWELAAVLDAESDTTDQPASLTAYELMRLGDQTQTRVFDDSEVEHVIVLFEQLCQLETDYSAAVTPTPAPDKVVEQAQLSMLEIDLLPISPLDVGPLHLQTNY